jgi:ATP-binding cassette subfamily B protein RaxB
MDSVLNFGWGKTLPVILQSEAGECGLASLAMVARYHGHDLDLASLRREFSTSLKGASLARLIQIAGELKFAARPLRLELDSLSKLSVPCILHWELSHFVVLKRVTSKAVIIHDPARGARRLSYDEVSRAFTGVALELTKTVDFKPAETRQAISLSALAGKVYGLRTAMVQIFTLALALEVFGLFGPFYMQWVVDQVLVVSDKSLLTLLGIGFLLVTVFSVVLTALRSWVILYLGTTLGVQWATNVFAHLLRLPQDFFEKRHVGDIVSRASAVQNIQSTLTSRLIGAILDGIMSIVTIGILFAYSPDLSLIVLGAFLIYVLLRLAFFGPFRRANEEQIVFSAIQQSKLLESIRGSQPIKLFNKQDERTVRYANALVNTANAGVAVQRLTIAFTGLKSFVFGIQNVVLIWLSARAVMDGSFTTGMLIAFTTYGQQFTSRAGSLIDAFVDFKMLRLYAERLSDIVLTEPELVDHGGCEGPEPDASIELRNVSFRYSDGEPWTLRHCNLQIRAGCSIAITGPSGCGKTTVAKLILGLLQPTEGTVLVGGMDIRKLGLKTYRDMVAAVMQEDRLFAGSIADNITFFDQDVASLRIEGVARLAGIHDEIVAMPMGYRSLVGDMGSALSGGQMQRVLLARALYRQPKILVLDEATSHLDVAREKLLNDAIGSLDITKIIIAHRLETIASADQTCLLTNKQTKLFDQGAFAPSANNADATTAHRGLSSITEDIENA